MGTKRIVWVKANPDYEILFRLMEILCPDAGRCYWIQERGAEGNIVDIGEELGQMEAEWVCTAARPTVPQGILPGGQWKPGASTRCERGKRSGGQ